MVFSWKRYRESAFAKNIEGIPYVDPGARRSLGRSSNEILLLKKDAPLANRLNSFEWITGLRGPQMAIYSIM
jgi:hypothetical protein